MSSGNNTFIYIINNRFQSRKYNYVIDIGMNVPDQKANKLSLSRHFYIWSICLLPHIHFGHELTPHKSPPAAVATNAYDITGVTVLVCCFLNICCKKRNWVRFRNVGNIFIFTIIFLYITMFLLCSQHTYSFTLICKSTLYILVMWSYRVWPYRVCVLLSNLILFKK